MTRLEKLRQQLTARDLSSMLIFEQHNITYLSAFTGHAATVLLTPQQNYLLTDYRYFEQAKSQASEFTVICRDRVKQSLAELIVELLTSEQVSILAYESAHISVSQWQEIKNMLNQDAPLLADNTQPVLRLVEDLRYIKDESEIGNIAQAADIADQALAQLLPLFQEGVTEREMALELEYRMSQLGSQRPAFDTILLFGERSALPHGVPGNRQLKSGDLILCDFGATINGYRSDMTRTFVFGTPSSQQTEIYNIVLNAQLAAIEAITAGVSGKQLNAQAQAVLNQSRYAQYQGEGLGHGVGLDLHEFPFIGQSCSQTIENGCVITIEPGIYIPKWGGIRIEDDVVLTEQGLKILTQSPKTFTSL